MPKHPTSSRVRRKPEEPDDAFVLGLQRLVTWASAHARQLVIGTVVVAVVAVVAVYYISSQRRVEAEAAARFTQVQQSALSGNTQLAIRDLQTFLQTFGGTDAARPARVLLADALLAEDRPEEAVDALGNLPRDVDDAYGAAAARLQAAAYEKLGDTRRALEAYRRLAEGARFTFERREALADAARVHVQNGDPAAAAEVIASIVETFDENEPGRGYYLMWLAEARAAAQSPSTTAAASTAPGGDASTSTPDTGAGQP